MSSHSPTDAMLISSERVTGTDVYNNMGDKLGSIEAMMIDKSSGQVRFAVMSFGGFLGMGERYHQLPWNGLSYDQTRKGYVVNISQDALKAAPVFSREELDAYDYDRHATAIDDYYGTLDGFYSPRQQAMRNNGQAGTGQPTPGQYTPGNDQRA